LRFGAEDARRFRDGDRALFRRLVDHLSPRLLAVTRSFAIDEDEAHDLLQETWLKAWRRRETFESTGTIQGWLYAVCRSVCLSKSSVRPEAPGAVAADAIAAGDTGSPAAVAERSELRTAIQHALLELPDREREVAQLRLADGFSTRETAEALGIAEGTVKATLHNAIRKLRRSMENWK